MPVMQRKARARPGPYKTGPWGGTAMEPTALRAYERMSPFEIKDALIALARRGTRRATAAFLNAGRGNPNWLATAPREAFFLLGQFAMAESRAAMDLPGGLGGMPRTEGIAARLAAWLEAQAGAPGAAALSAILAHATGPLRFDADAFAHELTDAILGDNYPVPVRMLPHAEQVGRACLEDVLCAAAPPPGRFDLFATEGATAAIVTLFRALKANRILRPGDAIALGSPIFTPYLEITGLEDYALEVVHLQARAEDRFQFAPSEIERLADPRIKAFLLVNPGNPTAVALSPETVAQVAALVRTRRPDLILITDDVYAAFVEGFRSLLAELPRNTVGIYSFSKYAGCTGWRLGLLALHEDNILDAMLAAQDEAVQQALDRRYAALATVPRRIRMIDRLAAESRDVALNHTAGMSGPQQVMLTLFALAELTDHGRAYRHATRDLLHRRAAALQAALGIDGAPNPWFDGYYGLVDLEYWMRTHLGAAAAAWMTRNVHPLDIVFRLAEEHGIVLLNGGGFHAPDWSVRVSFANLPDAAYAEIGRALRAIAEGYHRAFLAAGG